ncbi:thioredoxin-like 1-1, chloroplastic isoform X2 [Iris pallida]|uniref:Thioredoxin-like 1-1, chloroplastic isoform X2 n=1 Tax=Iris pallida TaxID=29817 RepID=A0AAX6H4U7_IRIPA|nr:thioredoxin-like 1-1, chloroplastic isoform X2 [Iris pallida]
MALSLRSSVCISGPLYEMGLEKKEMAVEPADALAWKSEFKGRQVLLKEQTSSSERRSHKAGGHSHSSVHAQQASICTPRALRWWDKSIKPNMMEIRSTHELVNSLLNAGDTLVILDFYSPGCGGCKALHPKICQLAESHPDAQFLKVNYEEHKSMCQSLHIHVLPFFRFYRGAQGRLCSFSCTNATVKKFKDALYRHGKDQCSLGPARGLEESELLRLASDRSTKFSYRPRSTTDGEESMIVPNFLVEAESRTAEFAMASM